MLSTKQYLLEAIETGSDDVLADLLVFFKHRQLSTANRQSPAPNFAGRTSKQFAKKNNTASESPIATIDETHS